MSACLDLYIEKLVEKMNLDEVQRVEVEKEIRGHLDEAIGKGVRSGLSEEEAEKEALLAFGEPSFLARRFGIISGFGWLVFERFALFALVVGGLSSQAMLAQTDPEITVGWSEFIMFYSLVFAPLVLGGLWRKIEVNGVLRVRRLFRKTRSIPFESVEKVTFQMGHLFGRRSVVIQYDGRKVKLSPKVRGFRSAAIALSVLAPTALEAPVSEHIESLRLRSTKEGLSFKVTFSAYWMIPILFLIWAYPTVWNVRSISLTHIASLLLGILGIFAQGIFQKDRSKKGICWLSALVFVGAGSYSVYLLFMGSDLAIRWTLVMWAILLTIPLVVLWWKGSKGILLGVVAFMVALAIFSVSVITPLWQGSIKAIGQTRVPPSSIAFTGINRDTIICICDPILWSSIGKQEGEARSSTTPTGATRELILFPPDGRSNVVTLPEAYMWKVGGEVEPGAILLKRVTLNGETFTDKSAHIIGATGQIEVFDDLPMGTWFGPYRWVDNQFQNGTNSFISFTQRGKSEEGKDDWKLGILSRGTGDYKIYDIQPAGMKWTSASEIRVMEISEGHGEESGNLITVWNLEAESGEVKRVATYKTESDVHPYTLGGVDCVRLEFGERQAFSRTPPPGIGLMDLSTGEQIRLPDLEVVSDVSIQWSEETGSLAYISKDRNLVLASRAGVVKESPIPRGINIVELVISPDGKKVLLVEKSVASFSIGSYDRYSVWDVESGSIIPIYAKPFMKDVLTEIQLAHCRFQWTPDSRNLVFPFGGSLWVAKYEDWAEKNLPDNAGDGT